MHVTHPSFYLVRHKRKLESELSSPFLAWQTPNRVTTAKMHFVCGCIVFKEDERKELEMVEPDGPEREEES
ncbi:MAG: hypothetical protein VXZ82_23015 [Planctomycetota bacterium]|nr:hypothetical protein [Planctomycetota bacterium]